MSRFWFLALVAMVLCLASPAFAQDSPPLSSGRRIVDAVGFCPNGTEMRVPGLKCEPGKDVFTEVTCPTGKATFRVHCPEAPEVVTAPAEDKPVRAFLVLDMSLTGGAFGLGGNPVTGGAQATFGLELRATPVVGVQFEGRIGVTGNYWDCQEVKASGIYGGGLFMTIRPLEELRLAVGVNGVTIRDSSWVKIVDGVSGVLRLDWLFYKDVFGVRFQGEVGPGWDAANQLHTWWSAVGGLVFAPPVLNKEVEE